jgi:hypothetical protein
MVSRITDTGSPESTFGIINDIVKTPLTVPCLTKTLVGIMADSWFRCGTRVPLVEVTLLKWLPRPACQAVSDY